MAGVFLGHFTVYAKEYETGVPKRMILFGVSKKDIIISKLLSQIIFVLFTFFVVLIFAMPVGLKINSFTLVLTMIFLLIIQSFVEFLLANSLVNILKKFGPSFALSMSIYFAIMVVSGNMGISLDMLPKPLSFIGRKLLPFVEFTKFNMNIALGKSLDFKMLFLTNLIFMALAVLVFLLAKLNNKRIG